MNNLWEIFLSQTRDICNPETKQKKKKEFKLQKALSEIYIKDFLKRIKNERIDQLILNPF